MNTTELIKDMIWFFSQHFRGSDLSYFRVITDDMGELLVYIFRDIFAKN